MFDKNNLWLEELRTYFDRELMRKNSLESKASYILGICSVMLPLLFSILLELLDNESFIYNNLIILCFLFFILVIIFILSLDIINITKISYPLSSFNPNNLNKFFNEDNFEEALKDKYLVVLAEINKKNNEKSEKLVKCFKLMFVLFIMLIFFFIVVFA